MNARTGIAQPILNHSVLGPNDDGVFLVVYACAHTSELTQVCECSSKESADTEADRLNREQLAKEEVIQMERQLRGFRRIVHGR
jgi:hypothetical protein